MTGMTIMNEAQYFFARAQHYFGLASEAEDAKEKKAFEAVATELWLKATTVLNRQIRLVDGSDMESSERRTAPPGQSHTMARHSPAIQRGRPGGGG
jgi:hypothetical protein